MDQEGRRKDRLWHQLSLAIGIVVQAAVIFISDSLKAIAIPGSFSAGLIPTDRLSDENVVIASFRNS